MTFHFHLLRIWRQTHQSSSGGLLGEAEQARRDVQPSAPRFTEQEDPGHPLANLLSVVLTRFGGLRSGLTQQEDNSKNHEEQTCEQIGIVKSQSHVFPCRLDDQPRHPWSNEAGQRQDRYENTQDSPTMCCRRHGRDDGH
jgi:hypothetical protein